MKYQPVRELTVPLYLRQAEADQNSAPQRDSGTANAALSRFLDLRSLTARKDFDDYQGIIDSLPY